ncbi:hypothetical protein OG689_10875 [Kitasatospora sp. NBC_00240]|uniref:hypothetical protein n=1 Tax=Kitasatospora sp. NBC_00240 TaxID=2903567 RepID=UPI00224EB5A6|nr:hypothetical protein [Kitasatospora sp. NBC_00240]MCX5209787.1 hypothetical protein [Kitasatospora sp. NBC_00240]
MFSPTTANHLANARAAVNRGDNTAAEEALLAAAREGTTEDRARLASYVSRHLDHINGRD